MNNALTTTQKPFVSTYEPTSGEQAFKMAAYFLKSGFYPDLKSPEQAFAIMAQGAALGLGAVQSLQMFDVIRGRPALRAAGQVAVIRASGAARYLRLVESTPKCATWETCRSDEPVELDPVRVSFTIEEAKVMGLTNRDQWKRQPATMLKWRAASKLAREVYPEVVMGLYDPEELREIEPERPAPVEVEIEPPKKPAPARRSSSPRPTNMGDLKQPSADPLAPTVDLEGPRPPKDTPEERAEKRKLFSDIKAWRAVLGEEEYAEVAGTNGWPNTFEDAVAVHAALRLRIQELDAPPVPPEGPEPKSEEDAEIDAKADREMSEGEAVPA